MAATLNDLGKTLLSQLYQNITGGDDSVPPAENAFVSWAQPGIPFSAGDFQFVVQGLSANVPAVATSPSSASTTLNGSTASVLGFD